MQSRGFCKKPFCKPKRMPEQEKHALCWLEGAVGIVLGRPPASGSLGMADGAAVAFPVFAKAEGGPTKGWSSSAFGLVTCLGQWPTPLQHEIQARELLRDG